MNSNGILHLSVNGLGRLSLWDTPATAMSGKEPDEVVVQISLTKSQMALVLRGESLAKQKAADVLKTGGAAVTSDAYRTHLTRIVRQQA